MTYTDPHPDKIKLDPVLRTYHVRKAEFVCYDISGFFSPISIRDQIIRASLVVDRAISQKLISASRPLLVVGAGPAGLTAAIKAAAAKIETVLVDKGKILEKLLSSDRYFSPVQYDWVSPHWKNEEFPWNRPSSIPTTLYEGTAHDSMESLSKQFDKKKPEIDKFLKLHQRVRVNVHYPLIKTSEKMPFIRVSYSPERAIIPIPARKEFGMGLSCTGFGGELVVLNNHNFVGVEFWSVDKFAWVEEGKVLICGGGDGALQDFLMFSTNCRTAKEIYEGLALDNLIKEQLEREIGNAEETAKKYELLWNKSIDDNETKSSLCRIYKELHETHSKFAEKLLAEDSIRVKLKHIVKAKALENIELAYKCNHFSACYPLNRFLSILIGKYIEREAKREVMLERSETLSIASADGKHSCNKNADECSAFPHTVILRRGVNCLNTAGTVIEDQTNIYDTVMLRFGIKEGDVPLIFGEKPAFPGLQILPQILS